MRNLPKTTYSVHMLVMAAVTVAVLLPFADKAFHIDDTLFIWTAKQISIRPWDFYGFQGNWDGKLADATAIIKNPPLAAYYLALAAGVGGWGEKALHTAFILPAFLAVWGTYLLARRMDAPPLLAAALSLATPAFMVSATTLMCDVIMLAFWVWAVFFWIKGVEGASRASLAVSGVLIAACSLTKYFGVSLIPLLAAYGVLKGKKGISSLPYLLIPVAALAGYHFYTQLMYGRGLLLDATSYATGIQASGSGRLDKVLTGLVFTGGCLMAALFFLPSVFGLRALIPAIVLVACSLVYLVSRQGVGVIELWTEGFGWTYAAQLAVYATAAIGICALAIADIVRRRDAFSVLLGLWVAGTFVFTVFFNWTVNARSVLPMAPAAAILMARAAAEEGASRLRAWVPVVLAVSVSLVVTAADYSLANTARDAARSIIKRHSGGPGTLWFQGHWGFQYYMEAGGARAIQWEPMMVREGEKVAFPFNNAGLRLLPADRFAVVEDFTHEPSPLLATMTLAPGAGFYASEWGPAPFMLFPPNKERYQVLVLKGFE